MQARLGEMIEDLDRSNLYLKQRKSFLGNLAEIFTGSGTHPQEI